MKHYSAFFKTRQFKGHATDYWGKPEEVLQTGEEDHFYGFLRRGCATPPKNTFISRPVWGFDISAPGMKYTQRKVK
ncbi:MAG: hypothetical protein RBT75_00305 [Anaerolineae bacterium]|jgi:hypothetical protein|nr:hypothetical protein [Anaerolineae bacterium]